MYGADSWYIAPLWLIPGSAIWLGLEMLCEHFHLLEKFGAKYPKYRYRAMKWLHCICGFLGYTLAVPVALLLYALIYFLTGSEELANFLM